MRTAVAHPEPATARRHHFRDFYDPAPTQPRNGAGSSTTTPLLVVVGNCQAESLRLLLDEDDVATVRLPAVHEITPADLPHLHDLLARTDLLVTQPISPDFHDLPLGTAQLVERLPAGARHAVVPSVRYAGLQPHHLLVHPPGVRDPDPPVVPYHDVRTLVAAAWARVGRTPPAVPPLTPAAVRAVAADSVAELRRREAEAGAVVVSDVLAHPQAGDLRTVNHPGNRVLGVLAARVRERLGLEVRPPSLTRALLDTIHAPLEPAVVEAHGLAAAPVDHWRVGGGRVEVADVTRAHLAWLAERPEVLDLALGRTTALRAHLGLRLPGGST